MLSTGKCRQIHVPDKTFSTENIISKNYESVIKFIKFPNTYSIAATHILLVTSLWY
jgi:hypothetical protein